LICTLSLEKWKWPKSRKMRLVGHVAWIEDKMNSYRLLVGQQEGQRQLEKPRSRWVDNITIDLGEMGWGGVDRVGFSQDRDRWRALVNSVLSLRIPYNAGKLPSGFTALGLSTELVSPIQEYRMSQKIDRLIFCSKFRNKK
jgi:hypothetical protein